MAMTFPKIGLMGKYTNPEVQSTLTSLVRYLQARGADVALEENCAALMPDLLVSKVKRDELGPLCDLVIVVGGDGSLLDAARHLVEYDVPVIGVNRGRRGFLTDISPQALTQSLEPILQGRFNEERRFLLEMQLLRDNQIIAKGTALNDVIVFG